ncbi:MAG: DUF4837 family protein [Bacteroidales bacterium]|nr:DUF4837 family protein [Bacteroidales bacterium]
MKEINKTAVHFSSGVIIFVSLALLFSCKNDNEKAIGKSSGKTAEILVVTGNNLIWNGMFGEALEEFFSTEYQILNQPEPIFEIGHIPEDNFTGTRMFRSHHNLLLASLNPESDTPLMQLQEDHWAAPQKVVRLTAPDEVSLVAFFNERKEMIAGIFRESDRNKLNKTFRDFRDMKIINQLEENFNLRMDIPGGFYIAKKYAGFSWLRKETEKNGQGLMIYTYDFTDTAAFNPKRIISYRNAITKEYIPGPSEGSFMVVSEDYILPESREVEFNGMYAIETRGLWNVENDFMGGPFVSYTFVDEKRNKVVTIDGYVYAPNSPKRDLLIQMEAIIHSMTLAE